MAYEALGMIRPFVKVSSLIAPRLTGNLAFKAFCRPPSVKNMDETQLKLTQRAESRMGNAEKQRVRYDGGEIQTYRFAAKAETSEGTVLLLHGWTGRAAFMSAFIEPLTQAGFDVLAVDLPAHGHSTGSALHVPLGVRALSAVHEKLGPWKAIVAHSFGGAIATSLVSGAVKGFPPIPIDRLVLIATPSSIPEIFQWFGKSIGLTSRGQYWLEANVLRLAGRELGAFEGHQLLRIVQSPTLVLHAPDDKEVSFDHAERLASAGEHVMLQAMKGLGHRRILYAPATVEAVRSFLVTPATPKVNNR